MNPENFSSYVADRKKGNQELKGPCYITGLFFVFIYYFALNKTYSILATTFCLGTNPQ